MTAWEEWETLQHHTRSSHCHVIMLVIAMNLYDFRAAGGIDFAISFTPTSPTRLHVQNLCMERRVAVKLHVKTCAFALGLTLSAALAGCSGSEQANAPAGGTNAIPPRTPSPGPGTRIRRPIAQRSPRSRPSPRRRRRRQLPRAGLIKAESRRRNRRRVAEPTDPRV